MNIAIILSGGVGSRMGLNIPKQYVLVDGQPIINYCLKTFLENENTDAIIIGVADRWKSFVQEYAAALLPQKPIYYSRAGETRQYSIYNALREAKHKGFSNEDVVLIHDAVRPLVSHRLIDDCYDGCREADGIMPVVAVKNTIYQSEDGRHIQSLLQRSLLWSGQSPEAFHLGVYLQAHDRMSREQLLEISGSTEIAFKAGLNCLMIKGDSMNFKITTGEDLSNFENIINHIQK